MSEPSEQLDLLNEFSWVDPTQNVIAKYAHAARSFDLDVSVLRQGMSKMKGALAQLGFPSLRPGQDEAVLTLMSLKDTYCVMPTGGGKSAIYIVPSLCMDWKTLIFSPLVSLMQDQVEKLRGFGLAGEAISSMQQGSENSRVLMNWETGHLQFLLVAPERMDSSYFMECMQKAPPDMVVVDEAHCISQWGQSFRPSYLRIGDFIDKVKPKVVLSLTATATDEVEQEIRSVLGMQKARRVIYYPTRTNLKHHTVFSPDYDRLLYHIEKAKGPVIVYCATRKNCDRLCAELSQHITGSALAYHGGQDAEERTSNQVSFMDNSVRVMFATNAFGLGVDKPDIRGVIHWDLPGSLEALVQEQGRAGRDGLDSSCVMFWSEKAVDTARWLIETSYPEQYVIERVFYAVKKLVNGQGVAQVTSDDLAASLGLNSKLVGSAIGLLTAARVFERGKDEDNPLKVKVLHEHADPDFNSLLEIAKQQGVRNANGFFEIRVSKYAAEANLKSPTLMNRLRSLQKEGYLEYVLPFRGKTTRIVGDVKQVAFSRIQERKALHLAKLGEVRDFVFTSDPDKHSFLRRYFGLT